MPFVTRIVQVQHINFTLLCAYCQVIVKCFILFCINNSLLHLPDDFQFRKCPVNTRRDRCPRCALYSFRNFSRNSAAPSWSLSAATKSACCFTGSFAFSIATEIPASLNISTSFSLSPIAMICSFGIARRSFKMASPLPLFIPSAVNSAFPATEVVV